MLESLFNWFEPKATWAIFTLLFLGFIICSGLFDTRHKELGYENKMLDVKGLYGPNEVKCLFDKIKPLETNFLKIIKTDGLKLYGITELTLDLVFPFIYCFLIIIPIIHLYSGNNAKYLILLPIFAALADICENISIAGMAFTFDGNPPSIAYLASTFTIIKLILLMICALVVLPVGAIASINK